jgi:hypothetical protein
MPVFHGEASIRVRVDISVKAENLEAATRAARTLSVSVDDGDTDVQGYDTEIQSVDLYEE